jgi:hypothetical protein
MNGDRLEYKRENYRKNKHRWQARKYLKYGMTVEEYEAMLEAQSYCCAICDAEEWTTRDGSLNTDHDHKTNVVRGLLCHSCNVGLGHFRDDPELLQAAAKYLLDRRLGT